MNIPRLHACLLALLCQMADASAGEPVERPLVHPLFADHMVLQRDVAVPVWGWTAPGTRVRVSVAKQTAEGVADSGGRWQANLAPMPAGGPHVMQIDAGEVRTLQDVLVGDVWVCAGQSNMEFPLSRATGGPDALARSDDDGLRIFTTPHGLAFTPAADFGSKNGFARWRVAGPGALGGEGGFSAVGYFFGRDLRARLRVPIGLLQCTWGGSPAEAWMPRDSLLPIEGYAARLAALDRCARERASGLTAAEQTERWWSRTEPGTRAEPPWFSPDFDDHGWKSLRLPCTWEEAGFGPFRGVTWLRREFDVPPAAASLPHRLLLGEIGTTDTVWINGEKVGETFNRHRERVYDIPPGRLRAGKNLIALRILNHGKGGFFRCQDHLRLNPAGELLLAPATSEAVSLAGEWRLAQGAGHRAEDPFPMVFEVEPTVPSMCHNGMVAPLAPFAIKGVVWYQGEANAMRAAEYRSLLPALITAWRSSFSGGEFPFLLVQLPAFGEPERPPGVFSWAEMRESQEWVAESTPGCGLAVTVDTGDEKDGHPPDKEPVGQRLARLAGELVYGLNEVSSGPVFREVSFQRDAALVRFAPNGSRRSDGALRETPDLRGFEVASADGPWQPASARVVGSDAVHVSAPADTGEPTAVRYAWRNFPAANLSNQAGLPARPFRTDRGEWPPVWSPPASDAPFPAAEAPPPAAASVPEELFANADDYVFAYREEGMEPLGREDRSPVTFLASRFHLRFSQDRLAVDSLGAPARTPSLADLLAAVPAPLPSDAGWEFRMALKTPARDFPVIGGPDRQAQQQAVEVCQYFQRRFLKDLKMADGAPLADPVQSGLEIAAWPDSLVLRWNFRPLKDAGKCCLEMVLGLPEEWRVITLGENALVLENPAASEAFLAMPVAAGALSPAGNGRGIRVVAESEGLGAGAEISAGLRLVALTGVPRERWADLLEDERNPVMVQVRQSIPDALPLPVDFDSDLGCVRVAQPDTRGRMSVNDAFVRLRLDLKNPAPRHRSVRILLDSSREVGMPGLSNLLTDAAGEPLGLPVALTKNWHDNVPDRFMGPWARRFLVLTLPPGAEVTLGLSQVYAWWAGTPAASVANLSCVGYPDNQQNWGQAALGGWQESMTFWPSPPAGEANICDVRPFLAEGHNAPRWGWSGNVGGGSWLRYEVDGRPVAMRRVLDHYAVQMPNLSSVTYRGVTADGAIASRIRATLASSDDFLRVFFRIRHDVLKPARFTRLAWFQLGADQYNYAIFNRLAIGTREGLTEEWPRGTEAGWQRRHLPMVGPVPWVSLHGIGSNDHTHPLRPGQSGSCAHDQTSRGLIVRGWKGRVRGKDVETPFLSVFGHRGFSPVTALAELTAPPEVNELLPGDYQEMDLEWVVFPSKQLRYHGPSRAFAEAHGTMADSWALVHREAAGNDFQVRSEGAKVLDRYPLRLLRDNGAASVEFAFSGGVGRIPVSIENLPGFASPALEEYRNAQWQALLPRPEPNQGGWQSRFEGATRTWTMDFTLPESDSQEVRRFRFRTPERFPADNTKPKSQ